VYVYVYVYVDVNVDGPVIVDVHVNVNVNATVDVIGLPGRRAALVLNPEPRLGLVDPAGTTRVES
jgi:hypothetical protein